MDLISVDIETTGLDPSRHETWEVAIVPVEAPQSAYCYQFPVTLIAAEDEALEVGRFEDRYLYPNPGFAMLREPRTERGKELPVAQALRDIEIDLTGVQLLGCSVHFDAAFLAELLGKAPWHHRHLDLGSYAAGVIGAQAPRGGRTMAENIHPNEDAHDALADAHWNVEVFKKLQEQGERQWVEAPEPNTHPNYPA